MPPTTLYTVLESYFLWEETKTCSNHRIFCVTVFHLATRGDSMQRFSIFFLVFPQSPLEVKGIFHFCTLDSLRTPKLALLLVEIPKITTWRVKIRKPALSRENTLTLQLGGVETRNFDTYSNAIQYIRCDIAI